MRLDKFLCQMNMGSRNDVKTFIKKKKVTVNGAIAVSPEMKIDETKDIIVCMGETLQYQPFVYYMLNKPQGVVSATTDKNDKTVLDLLTPFLPNQDKKREIVPAGRLDKDTEGLLLLTDDGALIHELLSPKKHVNKTYLVSVREPLTEEACAALEAGVDIGEDKNTLPARVKKIDEFTLLLSIREGKFHQVKRMLQAVSNEVISLKRVRFDSLGLDETLAPGECRPLTEAEIFLLQQATAPQIKKENFEAIIFDLDGTLVDSMWMWHQIDIEYLGRYGIPLPDKLQEAIEGRSFHETAVYFKETFGLPDSLDEIKQAWNQMAWDKYVNEVPLKPGIKDFLADCKKRGIKLGIATSNSKELVGAILDTHGLNGYFSCIKTGCEVIKGKPAPDIYLAAADGLGVAYEKCLVFEDILPGITAGKAAGMKVCAVEDTYSAEVRTQKLALSDYYITDYNEIAFL